MPRGRIYKMETKLLHLNLPVQLHEVLMRWSKASQVPASRFIVAMLMDNLPMLEQLAIAAEQARAGNTEALKGLKSLMMKSIENANQLTLELDETSNKLKQDAA